MKAFVLPGLQRQSQVDLWKFVASMVYTVSSKIVRDTQRNDVSQNQNQRQKKKKKITL